jgi:hypothetical protein
MARAAAATPVLLDEGDREAALAQASDGGTGGVRQPVGEAGEFGQRRARVCADRLQRRAQLAGWAPGWGGAAMRLGYASITCLVGIVLGRRGGIDLGIHRRSLAKIGCLAGRRLSGRTDRGKTSGCQAEADCLASRVGTPGAERVLDLNFLDELQLE